MVTFKHKGDFSKTRKFLEKAKSVVKRDVLDKYGREGVRLLSSFTPVESSKTAQSWSYVVEYGPAGSRLSFHNSNINQGVPIAVILQYGHGTGTGGWVEGRDYINPAVQPLFDAMVEELWKEVTK